MQGSVALVDGSLLIVYSTARDRKGTLYASYRQGFLFFFTNNIYVAPEMAQWVKAFAVQT